MVNFDYCTPTRVIFGRDADKDVGAVIKTFGAKKVLVHYGGGSAVRSGLIKKVTDSLDSHGIAHVELGGVEPNPKIALAREGAALAVKEDVDFVLAVGGGSVIDSSKNIALAAADGGVDGWEYITGARKAERTLPVGVVLTLAAAGSEMSNSHVLSDLSIPAKRGLNNDVTRPVVAFMNPENTFTVSKYQTGCGVVDIMMHTLERYLTGDADTELTDRIAEAILVTVKNAGAVAVEKPDDYEARASIMWASSLSHNGLTGCGKTVRRMPAHQLEHGLSGRFDRVSHGAGLSVLFPALAEYLYKYDIRRYCQLAVRVWGVPMNFEHPELTAYEGIKAMKEYFRSIGMPTTLSELDVPEDTWEEMADMITAGGTATVHTEYMQIGKKEVLEIFALAR